MASVYTNDLRLEEIGSGEQSGTWGDTTNTNLELIAEAFSFGTEAITTNADTHTTTIADGATDPGRSIYLKYTGTLDSACTITIGPNTVSKVWFIENATSGSQNIIISQGSGANVTIGNGAVKMVYSDGAGSGAAVVDALVDLDLTGTTTIAAANISGALTQDGGAVFNESSADVDFRVESNGNANMFFVDGGNDAVVIGHNDANDGSVSSAFSLQNIGTDYNSSSIGLARFSADVNAPTVAFHKSRNASIGGDTVVANNDELGRIRFFGNDGTDFAEGARITALVNGTPGSGDMPSELVFSTSADGAESPTDRMKILSSGNVEIADGLDVGTIATSTLATLRLKTAGSNNAVALNIEENSGNEGWGLGVNADGDLKFYNSGTGTSTGNSAVTFSDDDKVGIGTASPQQLLHVSANNPGGKIRLEMGQSGVADGDVTGEIQFYHNDSSGAGVNADIKGICTSSVGAGALTFSTGTTSTTERLRIGTSEAVFNEASNNYDFRIESDNSTHMLFVDASADAVGIRKNDPSYGLDVGVPARIITADNLTQLTLESTDTDSSKGPVLDLYRNSANPADNDSTGRIVFNAENDAGEKIAYQSIITYIPDVSDGTEDGAFQHYIRLNGTEYQRLEHSPTETVFNQDSQSLDFRVESDVQANTFFVEGSSGNVSVGSGTPVPSASNYDSACLHIRQTGSSNVGAQLRFTTGQTGHNANDGSFIAQWEDLNVYLTNQEAGGWRFYGGSTALGLNYELLTMDSHNKGVVFNDTSHNMDFRIESDGNANMFIVDAGEDIVKIGSDNSGYLSNSVNIYGASVNPPGTTAGNLLVNSTDSMAADKGGSITLGGKYTSGGTMYHFGAIQAVKLNSSSGNAAGVFKAYVTNSSNGSNAFLEADETEVVFNEAGGNVDFRVEADANDNAFKVDAGANSGVGAVLFGQSVADTTANGAYFSFTSGNNKAHLVVANTETSNSLALVFLNRQQSDGALMQFRHADSSEGSISVSGSTVSYNGFSGRHESSGIPTNTPVGTVVSTIDELDVYPNTTTDTDGNTVTHKKAGQTRADHAKVEISNSSGDTCVYGVVSEFDNDGKLIVTSVGIGSILVTGACNKGDLLESNGDGTAKVQSDDIIRSKTIGKVTIGNSNTGVKLVSCVLYCG